MATGDLLSLICLCMSSSLDIMAPRVASIAGVVGSGDGSRAVGWVGTSTSASASRYLSGLFVCREVRPRPLPRAFVPHTILPNTQLGHKERLQLVNLWLIVSVKLA